jgi:hypothetical protein
VDEPPDLSLISWAQVRELAARLAERSWEELPRPPVRENKYSPPEVIREIAVVVADVARFHAEHPEANGAALLPADLLASFRDEQRPRPRGTAGLGHLAGLFAGWLLKRPDRGDFDADLRAAELALAGSAEEERLAADLREFVTGYLQGSIDDEEFGCRLKKPRASAGRRRPKQRVPDPAAVKLSEAEPELRRMLEHDDELLKQDPRLVWTAFKRFAAVTVAAEPPERLDAAAGDMFKFECGSFAGSGGFSISLVRQFSVLDADDDYDRMEQLECLLSFEHSPEFDQFGYELIWSDGAIETWLAEVEHSSGFAAFKHSARSIEIDQSPV